MAKYMEVSYVFQDINNIPEGFEVPEGQSETVGNRTCSLSCIDEIDGPFAVINADELLWKTCVLKQFIIICLSRG